MTNQDLFTRIIENFQAYDGLQQAIAQDTTGSTGGLSWASGDLLAERRELLSWYAHTDMVIFRCATQDCKLTPFGVGSEYLQDSIGGYIECEYCYQPCDRLLSDGTWQTQAERSQLNQVEYQKVSG